MFQPNQSDQLEVEARVKADPNDEDSIMEDVGIIVDTPRTSIAMSDSQDASEESTRASTPTESRAQGAPADTYPLKPSDNDDIADDVTTRDLGHNMKSPTRVGDSKAFPWPSSAVIDPGSSTGKSEKVEEEFVDYDTDAQKLEELLQIGDPDPHNLYKP